MNTTFTRLLWKEYRAQRMLWIVLLLGVFGFYACFRLLGAPWQMSISVTLLFGVLYLVASFAIAFAGEVDDGTVGLLRMLPCRTSTLMSAKIAAVLSSCIALVVANLVLSAFFEFFSWFFLRLRPFQVQGVELDQGDITAFLFPILLLCAASLFTSLISRRVISAVGVASILVLAIYSIAYWISSDVQQYGTRGIVRWMGGTSMVLFAISFVVLSRLWHLGRLPRRWTLPEAAGNFADRRIPSFAGLWHRWLRRIVAQPMSAQRTMSTLIWREYRAAVPFALTWLTIGVVICAGRFFSNIEYPWPLLFLFLFIHECGQRTMREDQRSGSITLLANMGVHPLQIWLSKTFSWLLVMCVVGFVVVKVDAFVPTDGTIYPSPGARFHILDVVDAIRVPGWDRSIPLEFTPSTLADRWLQAGVCLAVVLGLFSIGQLTACWIRRQVIAFAASFIVTIAGVVLLNIEPQRNEPVWVALVPIPFCFLLATARTSRQWIDRSVTWRLRIRQIVWIVVPWILFPWLGQYVW